MVPDVAVRARMLWCQMSAAEEQAGHVLNFVAATVGNTMLNTFFLHAFLSNTIIIANLIYFVGIEYLEPSRRR